VCSPTLTNCHASSLINTVLPYDATLCNIELLGEGHTLLQTWQDLPPLDRAVLQSIARGVTDVFSTAVRRQLGKGFGEPAPSVGIVQKAVGRLTRREILVRVERGEYHVQDDVFLEWLKRPT
jgi:hypothetical protein